ncbi:MAG: hypothetical protein SLAVMIC_00809 [uncultured marine phage]|uniref:UVR domain-containing protein n=1 Tax=uncultured marine phage TaxID=707152 RepID=A0A8D9FRV0_9VIRU|nr:MAG: hypothetical protein SLAVMIC_00809 [uncultured marine phage]
MNIDDNDNDDFGFNEYDDFFNQFGENGLDPEKYKDYLKKIFNELTGQDIDDDYADDFMNLGNGKYMQDLSNEEEQEIFNEFIKDRKMDLEISFIEEDDKLLIEELWHSEEYGINLKRMYHYDHITIAKLHEKIQRKIYDKILPQLVEEENFEEAALVRDILNDLDNQK